MEQDDNRYKRGLRIGLVNGFIVGIALMLIVLLGQNLLLKKEADATGNSKVEQNISNRMDDVEHKIQTVSKYLDKYYYKALHTKSILTFLISRLQKHIVLLRTSLEALRYLSRNQELLFQDS